MKKLLRALFLLTSFIYFTNVSGQVGIGTELPNASAQLEVVAEDRGILIPRVALESTTDQTTIINGNVNSLLVFNTEAQTDITPGYYYWYIDRWRRLGDSGESFKETLTTLIDKGEGVFIYTDEEGGEAEIDVPAAVVNDIINQGDTYKEILNLIKSSGETITTLVDNGDGTITYYNEEDIDENGNIVGKGATVDVAGVVANNIINQGDVYDAIINILDIDSDELIDNGDGTFTHTAADGTVVDFDANTTQFADNGNGTYTFTNKNGERLVVDAVGDVVENIRNEGDIYNEVIEIIKDNADETLTDLVYDEDENVLTYTDENGEAQVIELNNTDLSYDATDHQLVYRNSKGETQEIDLADLVSENKTITTITNNGDGTYTYTNEEGATYLIDIPASIVNNFEEIVKDGPVTVDGDEYTTIEEYIEYIANSSVSIEGSEFITITGNGTEGDPYIVAIEEGDANSMLITNEDGELEWATIEEIVQENETLTVLSDNGDGTFTYTDENGDDITFDATRAAITDNGDGSYTVKDADGNDVIIDIPGDIIDNFESIVHRDQVTVDGVTYINIEEYFTTLAENNETITELTYDADENMLVYTDEAGNTQSIQLNITDLNYDVDDNTLVYTNSKGEEQEIDLGTLVASNETITTIIDNGDGTYTYTNEEGDTYIIDVPSSVVENFETIVNDGPVEVNGETYTTVEEYLKHIANESVALEGNEFIKVSGSGTENDPYVVAIEEGGANTLLITNEEGDLEWTTIEEIVQANETLTVLSDNGDGTFTYTDENGDDITFDATRAAITDNGDGSYTIKDADGNDVIIDIPGDIINNFESIVHGDEVTVDGVTYTNIEEYFTTLAENNETITELTYDADENMLVYTDEAGNTQSIQLNITDLNYDVDDNILVYTNSKGEEQEIDLGTLVASNETITTIIDNGDGTYTYTNEEGTTYIIDVPSSVVENFETIVNNGPVEVNGETYTTVEEYLTHIANESVALEGSEFIEVSGSGTEGDPYVVAIEEGDINSMLITNEEGDLEWATIEEIVQGNETVTTITGNNDGTFTYTNEEGTTYLIDIPASVVNNFEEIVKDGPITVDGDEYTTIEEYLTQIAEVSMEIEGSEFITITGSGTEGDPYVVAIEEGDTNTLLITNENGDLEWATIEEIVQSNETVTTITGNDDGTYTYTNEEGATYLIDIPASIVNNFEEIFKDGPITVDGDEYTTIEEYLTQIAEVSMEIEGSEFITITGSGTEGDPYVVAIEEGDANTLLITNENGDLEWATIEEIVQSSETVTTITGNDDGTYTYTNEEGTTYLIDIPASVVNNFEEILKDGPITVDGDEYTTIEEYLTQIAEVSMEIEGSEFITITGNGTESDPYLVAIEEGDVNSMLITNEEGDLEWATIEEIVQNGQKTYKVKGEGLIEVEEEIDENETTYTVKSNAPDFFYMPAVIFDTSVNGTGTRDLYQEYKDQFTGQQLDIAHGVNGSSMPYSGGLVGSDGAPQQIHVFESDELYYYVTYYDEDVFENLSISADGKLTYTVKNSSEPHSYMNVVFVIKDAE